MREVYLVMQSRGEYEDYREWNTGTVFLSLFSAEKVKQGIEDYNATEELFPFDWCDEYNFNWKDASDEDYNLYVEWQNKRDKKRDFNGCWIQTLTLEE